MSYYKEVRRAKQRIRQAWIPHILQGKEVDIDEIIYDIDRLDILCGAKPIKEYLELVAKVEGWVIENNIIRK